MSASRLTFLAATTGQFVGLILAWTPAIANEDKSLRAILESNWASLQRLDEQECQYSAVRYAFDAKTGKLARTGEKRIRRRPGFFREDVLAKNVTGIFAFNPQYCFSIGVREGKGAYLTRMTMTEPGTINLDIRREIQFGTPAHSYYPLSFVGHQPGPELLRNPTFRIDKSHALEGSLLHVDAHYDLVIPESDRAPLPVKAAFVLDTSKNYCVIQAQTENPNGMVSFTRTVEQRDDRFVCSRCVFKQPSSNWHLETEFVDYDFAAPQPKDQFFLSHFGLPEPIGAVPSTGGGRAYLWLLLAAITALMTAFVFSRRRRAASDVK